MKFSHASYICITWLACVAVTCFSVSVAARETYAAFASRITAQATAAGSVRPDLEAELFRLANAYRLSQGASALVLDPETQNAARAHAMDMMLHHFTGHVSSTGHDFDSRMRALKNGAMVLPQMGENAARVIRKGEVDRARVNELFQLWVKSAGHRHNLLDRNYLKMATGVVVNGNQLFADQIFTGPSVTTNILQVAPASGSGLY